MMVAFPSALILQQERDLSFLWSWFLNEAGFWVPAVIIVGFVAAVLVYIRPLMRTYWALKQAEKRLHSGLADSEIFAGRPRYLRDLWEDYNQRRAQATVEPEAVVAGSGAKSDNRRNADAGVTTVAPEEVFTEHAVLEGYNRNFAVTLAGVFTGLGILGTFIGLVKGLASIGATADPEQVMESVFGLLSGMHIAFYTSIFGISFSLLWLALDRTMSHLVQKHAAHFFQAVRVRYPVASAEWFLHRLYEVEKAEAEEIKRSNSILIRSDRTLEEQKVILQDLGSNMATAFQNALEASIGEQLTPVLHQVVQSIESLSTKLGDRQVEAMDRLVSNFQDRLSEQMGGQFEHLTSALQSAAEWQESVHEDLGKLLERVQDTTVAQQTVIERSVVVCELYEGTLERLSESHHQLDASAAALKDTSEMVAVRLTEATEKITDDLKGTLESAGSLTSEIGAAVERIDLQARALDERIESLRAEQQVYRDANQELRTHLAHQLDELGGQVTGLTAFWTEFRADLGGVGEDLKDSVAEFSVFTSEKLREIFARFDSEMATVVEHLSGTLAEVREITEDLPAGVERLRTTLADATAPISEAANAATEFDRTAARLTEALEGIPSLSAALAGLAPLNAHLENATNQVRGTDESLVKLREQLRSTDSRLGAVLEMVSTGNGEVNGLRKVPVREGGNGS